MTVSDSQALGARQGGAPKPASRSSRVVNALRQPSRLPRAVLRRVLPTHPKYGFPWVHRPDGLITFRESGFVSAGSPALLLARHNYETAHIDRLLDGAPVARSLEIGCGYGRLTPVFARHSREHVAVDINADALALARTAYPDHEFHEASADALPFPDRHFDVVVTWTVLQHVPPARIEAAVAEVLRVLAPGGTLLTCEETRLAGVQTARQHTWHRREEDYARLFFPLRLQHAEEIAEMDRLPNLTSPGRIMVWRAPDSGLPS